MTTVTLGVAEAELGQLPPVCLRCGAPATHWREHTFPRKGSSQTRLWVMMPLCAAHRYHWLIRYLLIGIGIWSLIGLFFGGLFLLPPEFRVTVLGTCGIGLVVWLGFVIRLETTAIR